MLKVVSINPLDRATIRLLRRDPAAALAELDACTASVNAALAALAKAFPGTVAIGAMVGGKSCGALVFAPSVAGDYFCPKAMDAVKGLANIVAHLPDELADMFLIEIDTAREVRRIKAEMEKAVSAALAAAADGPVSGAG